MMATTVIDAGLRSLAQQHHPDAGGNDEDLLPVNRAVAWLRDLLRQVA